MFRCSCNLTDKNETQTTIETKNKRNASATLLIEIKVTFEHNKRIEFGVLSETIVIDRWNKRCITRLYTVCTETCSSMTFKHRFCIYQLMLCVWFWLVCCVVIKLYIPYIYMNLEMIRSLLLLYENQIQYEKNEKKISNQSMT